MARIVSYGAYVPLYRLARQDMAGAWDIPALPGERSVANGDEDSLTMAVAAGLDCLEGVDPGSVDGLLFATTTAPYQEKQCASIIAAALGLRHDIFTADVTGSLRAATQAVRAAIDAVDSGRARNVLIVAGDTRVGEPETPWEQILGDGAGALLVGAEGPAAIRGFQSVTNTVIGPWRRADDRYVRSFEPKVETEFGYVRSTTAAAAAVLQQEDVAAADVAKAVIYAPEPRAHGNVAKNLGLGLAQLQDSLFFAIGNPGTPLVLMMLAGALESAKPGDKLLVAGYGDGADAFLVVVEGEMPKPEGRLGLSGHLTSKRNLGNYNEYARFRRLVDREEMAVKSSTVTYWRDTAMELALQAAKCTACGATQYPPPRICIECGKGTEFQPVALARRGTVYTFTLDHLVNGDYVNTPVPRVVVDAEGGGRLFVEMTDCDPSEVHVGMPVELTFRRLHEGASFHNYYWKCRPPRAVPAAVAAS